MRSILLAGGTGSRLYPLTIAVNKHLLPVGNLPMIGHSLKFLSKVGVSDVLIVTTPDDLTGFGKLLSSNTEPFNLFNSIYLTVQHRPAGIADAIRYGESFVRYNENILVLLGDNLFSQDDQEIIINDIQNFSGGAHIWTTKVDDPCSVGVLDIVDGKPTRLVEKPTEFISDLGVTGLYLFDFRVWNIISSLSPSSRGEYEVTDILNVYLNKNSLNYSVLKNKWIDLGQSLDQFWRSVDRIRLCIS